MAKKPSLRDTSSASVTSSPGLQGWIKSGWQSFAKYSGRQLLWVILFTFFSVCTLNLIGPIFMACLVYAHHALSHNEPLKISQLFAQLRFNIRHLLYFCLIYILMLVVFYMAIELPIRTYIMNHPDMVGLFILLALACQLLFCGSFFSSALIMLKHQKAITATKIGFLAVFKNSGSMLVLNILLLATLVLPVILWGSFFNVVPSTPLLALFLIWVEATLAIFLGALYAAYRDLFSNISFDSSR